MFHALVAVKQVPDTTNIRIDPETGNLIREGVPAIINPFDAHALASAIAWKNKLGGKVTIISMGPMNCVATIRECVELGADVGILITARQFSGADTLATSYVLAEVIKSVHEKDPIDVIFFGKQAIDGDTAQTGPGVGSRLGMPVITYTVKIRDINLVERTIIAERKTERWTEVIKAKLPAVLTCETEIAPIPYASLPNLVRSLSYEPEVWGFDSPILFDIEHVGLKGSPTNVFKTATPPPPQGGTVVKASEIGVEAAIKKALDMAAETHILESVLKK